MARIKLGNMITEIRGSINGNTYSKGAYGAYVRVKVTPKNPKTGFQTAVRNLFAALSSAWRNLTSDQIAAWNLAAPAWSRINIFGDNLPLSGFNLFKKLNGNLQAIGQPTISDVPAILEVPTVVLENVDSDYAHGTMEINLSSAVPGGVSLQLFATPGLSSGKTFVSSEYRQIGVFAAATGGNIDISSQYMAKFGSIPSVGQKVFVQAYFIRTDNGQPSAAQSVSSVSHA